MLLQEKGSTKYHPPHIPPKVRECVWLQRVGVWRGCWHRAVPRSHNLACNNWKAVMSSTGIGRDVQGFHCNKQQTCGLWKGWEAQTHLLVPSVWGFYSYLCWLRRHGCYWKDLWGKPFASSSSCPYGNEKNSGLLNHTAQDGKGCPGHTLSAVPASVLPSKSLIKLVSAIYLTEHFQSTWSLATRQAVGKRAGENRESSFFKVFFLNISVNTWQAHLS